SRSPTRPRGAGRSCAGTPRSSELPAARAPQRGRTGPSAVAPAGVLARRDPRRDLRTALEAHLREQRGDVVLHGLLRDPEPLADLPVAQSFARSEEHTSELQSRENLVCRLLLEKKNKVTG